METKKKSWARWLVPGFLFQSVVIGGGYGTGAEIQQYFLVNGFKAGMAGTVVTLLIWSLLCAVTFEFVRVFKTFDYKSMMDKLLGKAGILYEICYIVLLLIVLGVVNATAGEMMANVFGLPSAVGIIILSLGIFFLVVKGTEAIEKALSFWSYVLYAVYILFMVICFTKFGSTISAQWAAPNLASTGKALVDGAKYSFYNLGIVPALLYTIRDCDNRKEAVGQGLIAGAIGVIPAILLLVCLAGCMPGTLEASVPVTAIFDALDMRWLYVIFEIVLFGTLIETGTGFIKAVVDRVIITAEKKGKKLANWVLPGVTAICVVVGICVAQFGLTGLIAKGYGTICWGFLIIYVVPMLTIGISKIAKASKE